MYAGGQAAARTQCARAASQPVPRKVVPKDDLKRNVERLAQEFRARLAT
jgi:hypothetical protein